MQFPREIPPLFFLNRHQPVRKPPQILPRGQDLVETRVGFHSQPLRVTHHHNRENTAQSQRQDRDRSHPALKLRLYHLQPFFRRVQRPFIEGIHLLGELHHFVAPGE